jgi:hypothetical protein
LKCSIAQPNRFQNEGQGNKFDRPGTSLSYDSKIGRADWVSIVWESEEWLQKFAKPLDESGAEKRQEEAVEEEEA